MRQSFFIGAGEIPEIQETSETASKKIWQFHSGKEYILNISSNSLNITSNIHKSYNRGEGENFRDIIKYVLEKFMDSIKIPIITKMDLIYQDEMPIFERDNKDMRKYYKTAFDIKRFKFEETDGMVFKTATKRMGYNLIYTEQFGKVNDDDWKYTMDFDAYATNIKPDDYLDVLDKLYNIINIEYDDKITEEFKEYMRKGEV